MRTVHPWFFLNFFKTVLTKNKVKATRNMEVPNFNEKTSHRIPDKFLYNCITIRITFSTRTFTHF